MTRSVSSFIHLHVHTQYSLLEGAIKIPELVAKAKEFGMPAVAITDHGNMFGAVDFYFAAKAAEIKPLIGCEIYYTTGTRHSKAAPGRGKRVTLSADEEEAARNYRLVLLCKDAQGYRNLCELVTRAYTEGFHYKPRADRELIAKYSGGLVALTSGLKGEVGYHASFGRQDRAENAAVWLRETFKDDLYLELQENGLPPQARANTLIMDIAAKLSLPTVATADAHYLTAEQGAAHEALMCIGATRNLDDTKAVRLAADEFWFKNPALMEKQFHWNPEALENTLRVADKCNFSFKFKDARGQQIYHLPDYRPEQWAAVSDEPPPPFVQEQVELAKSGGAEALLDGAFSCEGFLRIAARKGLEERLAKAGILAEAARAPYLARLGEELEMIIRTGFAGYFLMVADFINYAKEQGIPVGPGRGSGAGSIVAWSLRITDLDPIPYNLLFERFLNPERVSMPDFDVDFCRTAAARSSTTSPRSTARTTSARSSRSAAEGAEASSATSARVMATPFAEVDQDRQARPRGARGITLDSEALEEEPQLARARTTTNQGRTKQLIDRAKALEGLDRHAGMHAAGVVIADKPLVGIRARSHAARRRNSSRSSPRTRSRRPAW